RHSCGNRYPEGIVTPSHYARKPLAPDPAQRELDELQLFSSQRSQ
ncbi:hypothetical protein JMJ77_0014293, partial [Colletotrichum scovillei]